MKAKTYKRLAHELTTTLEVRDVAAQETIRHLQLDIERMAQERDARELATVEQFQKATAISARQVHEAFISAQPTARPWEEVTDAQRARYEKMASRLNDYLLDGIRLHVATQESGYVWSAEEV